MVKEMRSDWGPWPTLQRKHNHIFVKLFVSAILIGISFRLFFSHSDGFLPVPETPNTAEKSEMPSADVKDEMSPTDPPSEKETSTSDTLVPEMALDVEDQQSQKEKCDLFTGEWIPNPSGPTYTNVSCPFMEAPQNCMKNGRPDSEYLYWRWKPQGCELPVFDAEKFLDVMRNKSWAVIGDSISRNHVQSFICLLSQAEGAVEVYHDKEYKCRRWHFSSHNFTLSLIWAPFLIKADIFENDDGESTSEIQLHLDTLDRKWTSEYHKYDYIVISGGQWFLKTAIFRENNTVVGCHYCAEKNLTALGFEYSYRKALQLTLHFLTTSDHKARVLFRTWTPDHFENGRWFNGGVCNRTVPFREREIGDRDMDEVMRSIELEEFDKAAVIGSENGVSLKLLDTTHLSMLRPDGHPGPYRQFHPFAERKNVKVQNDCLHWCLPGPIDAWNDLLMEMVLNR